MSEENIITYRCGYCGEENETFVDPSGGGRQIYTEDCAICCRPNVLTVTVTQEGKTSITVEFEG